METHIIKLFNNRLYGSTSTNLHFSKYGSDSEEEFKKISESQPANWIYRSKEITYHRNSHGHRCKEISDLNGEFILFVGCSLTDGISIALEDSYPILLSKQLHLDYYNLSVPACGADLISLNLSYWFNNIKKIPKIIVLQWPAVHRKFNKTNEENLLPIGPWIIDRFDFVDSKIKKEFINGIDSKCFEHYFDVLRNVTLSYISSMNICVVELFADDFVRIDFGRDLTHPGIESQKRIANLVLSRLNHC